MTEILAGAITPYEGARAILQANLTIFFIKGLRYEYYEYEDFLDTDHLEYYGASGCERIRGKPRGVNAFAARLKQESWLKFVLSLIA
jgi:hypothetical protein